jgi:hypothetical protein
MRRGAVLWLALGILAGVLLALVFLRSGWAPGSGPVSKVVDPPAVLTQIRALRELVTVKYRIQKVVAIEEKKVPFGTERMLLFVQAEIAAGLNLSDLDEQHVMQLADGSLIISLPHAAITSVVIDDNQTRVWDRSVTWWTPWVAYNQDLERQARLMAKEECEKAAVEMGILQQARTNAEEAIRTLLVQAGASSVRFLDAD